MSARLGSHLEQCLGRWPWYFWTLCRHLDGFAKTVVPQMEGTTFRRCKRRTVVRRLRQQRVR